jgi:hypothetical protein
MEEWRIRGLEKGEGIGGVKCLESKDNKEGLVNGIK